MRRARLTLRGTPTGTRADISLTSFALSHIITAAGTGGMVCFDDDDLADGRCSCAAGDGARKYSCSAHEGRRPAVLQHARRRPRVRQPVHLRRGRLELRAVGAVGRVRTRAAGQARRQPRPPPAQLRAHRVALRAAGRDLFTLPRLTDGVETGWHMFPCSSTPTRASGAANSSSGWSRTASTPAWSGPATSPRQPAFRNRAAPRPGGRPAERRPGHGVGLDPAEQPLPGPTTTATTSASPSRLSSSSRASGTRPPDERGAARRCARDRRRATSAAWQRRASPTPGCRWSASAGRLARAGPTYPGSRSRLGAARRPRVVGAARTCATEPGDTPIDLVDSELGVVNFNGVGGGTVLYAAQWPRCWRTTSACAASMAWPTTGRSATRTSSRSPGAVDRQFGVSGLGGNPAYPPGADPPLPPLPDRTGGPASRPGAPPAGLALVARLQRDPLGAVPRARNPCVQRGTCMYGCNEGAKASTDLTHWPQVVAAGGRVVTGARVRRITVDGRGLATGAEWLDREGREHFQSADVVVCAANSDRDAAGAAGVGVARPPRRPGQRHGSGGPPAHAPPARHGHRPVRRAARRLACPRRRVRSSALSSPAATRAAGSCAAPSGRSPVPVGRCAPSSPRAPTVRARAPPPRPRTAGPQRPVVGPGRGPPRGRQPGRAVAVGRRRRRPPGASSGVPQVGEHQAPARLEHRTRPGVADGGRGLAHRRGQRRPERPLHGHGPDG